MADPGAPHVVQGMIGEAAQPAPYDAASDTPAGPWVKVETAPAGGAGHGWDPPPDGDGGPWRQT